MMLRMPLVTTIALHQMDQSQQMFSYPWLNVRADEAQEKEEEEEEER